MKETELKENVDTNKSADETITPPSPKQPIPSSEKETPISLLEQWIKESQSSVKR